MSIGLEMLTDPLILFIDEPTLNVEYFEAENVVRSHSIISWSVSVLVDADHAIVPHTEFNNNDTNNIKLYAGEDYSEYSKC